MFRRRPLPRKYLYFILLLALFSVLYFAQRRDKFREEQVPAAVTSPTADASGALIRVTAIPTETPSLAYVLPLPTEDIELTAVQPTEPPEAGSAAHTPSPEPSEIAMSLATQFPTALPTVGATETQEPGAATTLLPPTRRSAATATRLLTDTPVPPVTASPTQSGAATMVPTSPPPPTIVPTGGIEGRITYNGLPAAQGITLILEEDQIFNTVTSIKVGADGRFAFSGIPASDNGFNVLFAQEWNESAYDIDQVISWGWIGPIEVVSGQVAQLPDFEIGQRGFSQKSPPSDATFSAASISASTPLTFEWTAFPPGTSSWVDLTRGKEQAQIWQSDLVNGTTVNFDGTLTDGSQIGPGDYWWGVGAFSENGAFTQTIYGYLFHFTVTP